MDEITVTAGDVEVSFPSQRMALRKPATVQVSLTRRLDKPVRLPYGFIASNLNWGGSPNSQEGPNIMVAYSVAVREISGLPLAALQDLSRAMNAIRPNDHIKELFGDVVIIRKGEIRNSPSLNALLQWFDNAGEMTETLARLGVAIAIN